jgi:hypothetical protein
MAISPKRKRLLDAYRFTSFRPMEKIRGIFGDPRARVITLVRRSKKQSAAVVAGRILAGTTKDSGEFGTSPVATHASIWKSRFDGCFAGTAEK